MKFLRNCLIFVFFYTICFSQEYQLVWSDEFNGSTLDTVSWGYMYGDGSDYGMKGWGNNELQWYSRDNVTLDNGKLFITTKAESLSGYEYSSARIRTSGRADWKYGKFEIKLKLPVGKGLWPAVWLLPTENIYGGWASSGEIDIMEYLGHEPDKVHGTLHYGGSWPENKHTGTSFVLQNDDFSKDFHVFTLEWEEKAMRWFVDDSLYQTQTSWFSSSKEYPAPFDQKFHLIFNVAVGGNWPGSPDENTLFPQAMIIDYVRVYQKNK